jgi:hypothetical protein
MRRLLGTFKATLTTGVPIGMKKTTFTAGMSALAVTALAVGVFSFSVMRSEPVSAARLISDATAKTQQMSPSEIAQFNTQWREDVSQRLTEARDSDSLRVVSADEVNAMGGSVAKAGAHVATYVTYTDGTNHRIVVGLDGDESPVLLFDVDATPNASAPAPNMQLN